MSNKKLKKAKERRSKKNQRTIMVSLGIGIIIFSILIYFQFLNDPVEIEVIPTPDGQGFTTKTKHLKTGITEYHFNYRENIGSGGESETDRGNPVRGSHELKYDDLLEIDKINNNSKQP